MKVKNKNILNKTDLNNNKNMQKEASNGSQGLSMVLLPGAFGIDSTNLRESLKFIKTDCLFHENMFILSEEVFLDKKHLEIFHVGLGLALKYKFLSFFVKNVRLKSTKGNPFKIINLKIYGFPLEQVTSSVI
jgi:hypothetical protein